VIEGLELVARSEAAIDAGKDSEADDSVSNEDKDGNSEDSPGSVLKRISKGALKMLKKHIDTLSLSLEE